MSKAFLTMVTVFAILLLTACGQGQGQGEETKKLLMGTSADFPPFETRDNKGEIVGFDIDLAKYIATELGYELEIQDMNFDGLVGALQANRVDFVASGMSATDTRKESVDFSDEYHRSGEMFVTLKDSELKGMADLEGKHIAVQLGTIQEEGAKKLAEKINLEIKVLDKVPNMIQELKSGRVDGVYLDKAVGQGYVKELDLAGFDDESEGTPGMAIAFPKGSELIEDFNRIIAEMQENGELAKLHQKWIAEEE
ncbi:basic amino acid ABC transporter substrate-binding protein [Sutcliffiella sp. NC1]|uniref:basic amino acid ABC transporter substrate-binding protein n=1 Tax=Sutcliffiella sp. NC1 TaxID=3004096 RepID=UPI0022DE3E16|nr:basic amino acid ABC transporter substrate-binding protein [Sutcliffiella sp. NC1]WBL14851.1 basic amino acid ABC transporter substrate-binding protein [Sutcliffiella sp. NC1]